MADLDCVVKCRECGYEYEAEWENTAHVIPSYSGGKKSFTMTIRPGHCPQCSEKAYGPIREGMLAEALWEATSHASEGDSWQNINECGNGAWDGDIDDARAQARFVIRLLETIKDWPRPPLGETLGQGPNKDWRYWLLSLAKTEIGK